MENPFEVTETHFATFVDEAEYWIRKYGLFCYEWTYLHRDLEDLLASATYNVQGKAATLALAVKSSTNPTDRKIRRAAYHEVLEVMLGGLNTVGAAAGADHADLDTETHTVIRIMENVHFEDDYARRHGKPIAGSGFRPGVTAKEAS
jgi:hypothetical protein